VTELRLVVTAADYEPALRLYRDVRVAGHIRVAFEVGDTRAATAALAQAGATVIAEPVPTPWQSLNARLEGPAGLQLTLFGELPSTQSGPPLER
jgi:hypothetical protein